MAKHRRASDGIADLMVRELSRFDPDGPNPGWVKNLSEVYDRARDAEAVLFAVWEDHLSADKEYDKLQNYVNS